MKKNKRGIFSARTWSNIAVICIGVLLYIGLSNFVAIRNTIKWLFSIVTPFIVGIGIAYLLNLPMRFLERKLFYRFKRKRTLSVIATYALAVILVLVLIGLILPQLITSIRQLLGNVSLYLRNINSLVRDVGAQIGLDTETVDGFMLSYNDIVNNAMAWVRSLLPNLLGFTLQVGNGLIGALTTVIVSIYLLAGKEKLLHQFRRVLYALFSKRSADELMRIGKLSNGVFSGFISGKILDSAIIAAICFAFMTLMNILSSLFGIGGLRMPFTPLISVIIGVTNVIPFFGPVIGAIPSIMILFMANPWSAVWFTLFIIVLQQFDGNYLGPRILGYSTGLPAIWVLVSIVVGSGLFGFTGMLLAVPTTAVLYTLASDLIEKRLARKGLEDTDGIKRGDTAPTGEAADIDTEKQEKDPPQS